MPRIRTFKPEFFTSEDINAIKPYRARLTFLGLWAHADDQGRLADHPKLIKAAVWPLDDDVDAAEVEKDLQTLAHLGRIIRYIAHPAPGRDGDPTPAIEIVNFRRHQYIAKPTGSKYLGPEESDGVREGSGSPPVVLPEPSNPVALPDGSGSPTGEVQARKEGRKGKGKGIGEGDARARTRCHRHENLPDEPPPCRACKAAREEAEWLAGLDAADAAQREREERIAAQLAAREAPRPDASNGRAAARALLERKTR